MKNNPIKTRSTNPQAKIFLIREEHSIALILFFLILYYLHADIDITAFVKKSLSEADDLTSLTPDMRENNRKAAAVAATLAILKTTSANNDLKDEIPPPRESQR